MKKKIYCKQKQSYMQKKDSVLMMVIKSIIRSEIIVITGKYRRAAHDICNLRYKTPKKNSCNISHRFYIRLSFKIKTLAK